MSEPTPTELIADAREYSRDEVYPGAVLIHRLATALEARLAEIDAVRELIPEKNPELIEHGYSVDAGELLAALASAGSSSALEAVKADTPAPLAFVNSVPNDGRYEYTSSSDCDGSDQYYRARVPAKHAEAGPWFPISAEDYVAASKNWRGDWLPVETEGDTDA